MGETAFRSPQEFCEVMDRTFTLMSEDPRMGPKLRDANVPQRFEFPDLQLVVNIRSCRDGEPGCLHWAWTDDIDWESRVRMTMSSKTANRYFQGRENLAVAIARRRIETGGDVRAALAILPILEPIFARYSELVASEYGHLRV